MELQTTTAQTKKCTNLDFNKSEKLEKSYYCRVVLYISLSDPCVHGVSFMSPGVCPSLTDRPFADLTDVTLAGKDTNSILTDDANWTIQGNKFVKIQLRKIRFGKLQFGKIQFREYSFKKYNLKNFLLKTSESCWA